MERNFALVISVLLMVIQKISGEQHCYSCSSKSPLCRKEVWDGQYLSMIPCKSKCFMRTEGKNIYRGCFDGWFGGMVKSSYQGCRKQVYLGEEVEWCFCQGQDGCNADSRDTMSKKAYARSQQLLPAGSPRGRPQLPSEHAPYLPPFALNLMAPPGDYVIESDKAINPADVMYHGGNRRPGPEIRRRLNRCIGQTDGSYGDMNDCTSYYICSNGLQYHMHCAAGTVWNQRLHSCSYSIHPQFPCKFPSGDRYPNHNTNPNHIQPPSFVTTKPYQLRIKDNELKPYKENENKESYVEEMIYEKKDDRKDKSEKPKLNDVDSTSVKKRKRRPVKKQ